MVCNKKLYSFRKVKHVTPYRQEQLLKCVYSLLLLPSLLIWLVYVYLGHVKNTKENFVFNYFFFFARSTKSSSLKLLDEIVFFKKNSIFSHISPPCPVMFLIPFLHFLFIVFCFSVRQPKIRKKKSYQNVSWTEIQSEVYQPTVF